MIKLTKLSIEIETNCQDLPKMSCLNRFLDLDQDILIIETLNRDHVKTNRGPQAYQECFAGWLREGRDFSGKPRYFQHQG